MVATLGRTPAFNRTLQVDTVLGTARPALLQSMYDRAEYLYQVAFSYRAMAAQEILTGGAEAMPTVEVYRARMVEASRIAEDCLRLSPGHADAWMLLAQAEAILDHPDRVITAYRNSLARTPYNRRLAFRRLMFALGPNTQKDDVLRPALAEDLAMVETDIRTLHSHAPASLARFEATFPGMHERLSAAMAELGLGEDGAL